MEFTTIDQLYELYINHPVVSKDTREISKGCIYFALKGGNFDGNDFAQEALNKGAAYAVIDNKTKKIDERYILVEDCLSSLQQLASYHRQKLDIPVLAITGSNGKTTTKELIATVLSKQYNTLFTSGNYNNHIGVPLTILGIRNEHQFAVIEMGANHQGEIQFLCSIANPDFGIITNIGKAHLEGFGGVEGVKKGKSELYRHIENKKGTLFINQDDPVLVELCLGKTISYGKNEQAYCKGELESSHPTIKASWFCNEHKGEINSKLYGEYNFYNILSAICVGNYFNISPHLISNAINEYTSDMNRSQLIERDNYKVYLDAYNANPTSMALAIENFEKSNNTSKTVILGDMFELGKEAKKEHGKIVQQLLASTAFDKCILVGENFFLHQLDQDGMLFFKSTEEAKTWFKKTNKVDKAYLLKGSRGMKMESLLQ